MRRFLKDNFLVNGHISAEKKHYNCSVSVHSHEFFEFEYIISGSGTYNVDGIDHPINDRTLYFMTPVNFHSVDMRDAVFYNVMFSADMCNINVLSKLFSSSHTVISADDDTHTFICALLDELEKNCNNIEYSSLLLETFISKLSTLMPREHKAISYDIKSAELYILENFKRKLTLTEIAKNVMLSHSHFSRKFARETGKSFKEYLNGVRFEYAKKLLIYSELNINQICFECGFEDYPNFVRRFKQNIGESPTAFRKRSINTIK